MRMNTEDFTSKVVTVVIAIIVIGVVAIPVINKAAEESGADSTTVTILGVIPIFLILAVLMTVVYMFLDKKN